MTPATANWCMPAWRVRPVTVNSTRILYGRFTRPRRRKRLRSFIQERVPGLSPPRPRRVLRAAAESGWPGGCRSSRAGRDSPYVEHRESPPIAGALVSCDEDLEPLTSVMSLERGSEGVRYMCSRRVGRDWHLAVRPVGAASEASGIDFGWASRRSVEVGRCSGGPPSKLVGRSVEP